MASDEASPPPEKDTSQVRSFLTLKETHKDKESEKFASNVRRQKTVLETIPGAGPRIMETHDELKKLAENMDKKVHDMLREHEQDFFLAYKTHMYGLQKEFKALKAKADEEDTKTRRDLKIQSLERELDWFMAEAVRLDELCRGYKKEVDKWKAKAEAIEEDRRYLEDQIKGSKRQNKVLRAAVDRANYAGQNKMTSSPTQRKSLEKNESESQLSLPPLRPNSAETKKLEDSKKGKDDGRHSAPPEMITDVATIKKAASPKPKKPSEEEQRLIDAIKSLKDHLKTEQHTIKSIRAERGNAYSRKSALEEFFLSCVDESRKDLARKKRPGGPKPLDEEEKVRDLLLSSEDVLVYLYEKLFPHRAGMAHEIQTHAKSVLC